MSFILSAIFIALPHLAVTLISFFIVLIFEWSVYKRWRHRGPYVKRIGQELNWVWRGYRLLTAAEIVYTAYLTLQVGTSWMKLAALSGGFFFVSIAFAIYFYVRPYWPSTVKA